MDLSDVLDDEAAGAAMVHRLYAGSSGPEVGHAAEVGVGDVFVEGCVVHLTSAIRFGLGVMHNGGSSSVRVAGVCDWRWST
ncbi:MAG: hypothetical protein KY447_10855 [Actinobacteria bacterium]|nr:hypothetical protein [Actinomycetota bacterium]MBW3643402.1 hypothetical protein [Actinomycetota bacterium]